MVPFPVPYSSKVTRFREMKKIPIWTFFRLMKAVFTKYLETRKGEGHMSSPDYLHSGSGSLKSFYAAILNQLMDNADLSQEMAIECKARLYLYFQADIIKTKLSIFERRKIFPNFVRNVTKTRSEQTVKSVR